MNAPLLHVGKIAKAPKIIAVRPLVREDLAVLRDPRPSEIGRPQKLREHHRRLAMMFARGYKDIEVAAITGYSIARLAQLRDAPAFQELVAKFMPNADAEELDIIDEYRALRYENALKAERMIGEHLDRAEESEDGELIPIKSLIPISHDFADRFGYSKKSVHGHVNMDFAAEMEAMQARSGRSSVIDAKAATAPLASSPALAPSPSEPSQGNQSAPSLRRRV